jgi:hypothetical protein
VAESEMLFRRLLTATEEIREERQVGRSPGTELNSWLPEYEAEVLPIFSTSVRVCVHYIMVSSFQPPRSLFCT